MNQKINKLIEECRYGDFEIEYDLEKLVNVLLNEVLEIGKEVQHSNVSNASEEYNLGRQMGVEVYMNRIKDILESKHE